MIAKIIDFGEKLSEFYYSLTIFMEIWVARKNKFSQKIKNDGVHLLTKLRMRKTLSHHITQIIFHFITKTKLSFSTLLLNEA